MPTVEYSVKGSKKQIRYVVIDGFQYLSPVDFISVWCDWSIKESWAFWIEMPEPRRKGLYGHVVECKFNSFDQAFADGITISGAMKLSKYLVVCDLKKMTNVFPKLLNAFYNHNFGTPSVETMLPLPGAQTFAGALGASSGPDDTPDLLNIEGKKRQREADELDLKEQETRWKFQEFQNLNLFVSTMESIDRNWATDEALAIRTKNWAREIAFGKPTEPSDKPLSVLAVAKEMGYTLTKAQLKEIEKNTAAAYKSRYLSDAYSSHDGGFLFSGRDHFLIGAEITRYFESV